MPRHRARQRHALLLAGREVVGIELLLAANPHLVEKGCDPVLDLGAVPDAGDLAGDRDVLVDVPIREKAELLP
jgi:hypothetical protein